MTETADKMTFTDYFYLRRSIVLAGIVLGLLSLFLLQRPPYSLMSISDIMIGGRAIIGEHGALWILDPDHGLMMVPALGLFLYLPCLAIVTWYMLPSTGQKAGQNSFWTHADARQRTQKFIVTLVISAVCGALLGWISPGLGEIKSVYRDGYYQLEPTTYNILLPLLCSLVMTIMYRFARVAGVNWPSLHQDSDPVQKRTARLIELRKTCNGAYILGTCSTIGVVGGIQAGITVFVGIALSQGLIKVLGFFFPDRDSAS